VFARSVYQTTFLNITHAKTINVFANALTNFAARIDSPFSAGRFN